MRRDPQRFLTKSSIEILRATSKTAEVLGHVKSRPKNGRYPLADQRHVDCCACLGIGLRRHHLRRPLQDRPRAATMGNKIGDIRINNLDIRRPPIPPEMRLLLMCSRPTGIDADKEAMEVLLQRAIDWETFIKLVEWHCLPATVYLNLKKLDNAAVPENTLQGLHTRYLRNARRAVWLTARLVALLGHFERESIPVLPLKGPVLALQAFDDVVLRHAGDLDLLMSIQGM